MADENKKIHNGLSEDKPYTFVKETIRPRKKNKVKRILLTGVSGIVFGMVSCIVFCLCLPLFSDYFQVNSKQIIIGKGDDLENVNASEPSSTILPTFTPEKTAVATETVTATPVVTIAPSVDLDAENDVFSSMSSQVQEIYQEVNRSIVTVTSVKSGYDIFNIPSENMNSTCGIIVGESDHSVLIYVNESRIDSTDDLLVTLSDGTVVSATLYNTQDELGIAIIAISLSDLSRKQLLDMEIADFDTVDSLQVGDAIIALGNPNGHMYSFSCGYISNEPYSAYITDNAVTLINTTIAYNTNGEGIIVNMEGKIIGFITHEEAFASGINEGVNTCFSVKNLKTVITKLVEKTDNVYFGIVGNDITTEISYQTSIKSGVYVISIDGNSPAFNSDIKKGDVITEINGTAITGMVEFNTVINKYNDGERVKVNLLRMNGANWAEKSIYVDLTILR